jgi:hypothetical protein
MVPLGYVERLGVSVLNDDQSSVDTSVSGQLMIESMNVEIVSVSHIEEGYGYVDIRVLETGLARVSLEVEGDDRRGRTGLYGYVTKLPVWEITVDPIEFAEIWATPFEKIKIEGSVVRDGVEYSAKLRLHGGASRDFIKKSLERG